jgi:hypothetical protein
LLTTTSVLLGNESYVPSLTSEKLGSTEIK